MPPSPLVFSIYQIEGGRSFSLPPSVFPWVICQLSWENPENWYLAGYVSLFSTFPGVGQVVVGSSRLGINEPRLLSNQYGAAITEIRVSPVNWLIGKTVNFAAWGVENG